MPTPKSDFRQYSDMRHCPILSSTGKWVPVNNHNGGNASPNTSWPHPGRPVSLRAPGAFTAKVAAVAVATPEIQRAFFEVGADFCPAEVTGYYYEYD